jgi:Spy/CpxP family protein refolding chaperone
MRLSRAAIALYLGIVFASGGALGFFANRLYTNYSAPPRPAPKSPQEFRKGLVENYKKRLQLTDDQVQQLQLILDDANAQYQAQFKKEREAIRPELGRIHQDQVDRINAMLNPTQRDEYKRMLEERERLRLKKGNRSGGQGI